MVRVIPPEESIPVQELSTPVQCETDRTGLNGVVVYDDQTYAITFVGNHQPRNQPLFADNTPVGCEELEWQLSTEDIHDQEQNLEFQPSVHLMSDGRYNAQLSPCPFCLTEPTKRLTTLWRNKNARWVVILAGVMLLLSFLV